MKTSNGTKPKSGQPKSVLRKTISESELGTLEEQLWRRVRKEVGPSLFVDMLEDAANNMLTDIELGKVRTARLFDAEGKLTKRGADYLSDAASMAINPGYNGYYSSMDLRDELEAVFDMDTFAYFKAERKVKGWH